MKNLLQLAIASEAGVELAWAESTSDRLAIVLSVVRYGGGCQFGDVVRYDADLSPLPPEERLPSRVRFVEVFRDGGGELHRVIGGPLSQAQALELTAQMRAVDLAFEAWSPVTYKQETAGPLSAGLILPKGPAQRLAAERAADILRAMDKQTGVRIYAPTVLELAGDELGARRHRAQCGRFAETSKTRPTVKT